MTDLPFGALSVHDEATHPEEVLVIATPPPLVWQRAPRPERTPSCWRSATALQQPGHIRDEAKPTPKRLVCDLRQPVRRGAAGFRDLGMCGGV